MDNSNQKKTKNAEMMLKVHRLVKVSEDIGDKRVRLNSPYPVNLKTQKQDMDHVTQLLDEREKLTSEIVAFIMSK